MSVPDLVAALLPTFTTPDGGPAEVGTRPLTALETAALRTCGGPVVVPDAETLRELAPGAGAALAVLGGQEPPEQGILLVARGPVGGTHLRVAEGVNAATAGLARTVAALRSEASVIDALHSAGRRLTAQLDIAEIVQEATDAATTAVGAAFGAFFYNLVNRFGESYTLYTLSGAPREAFSRFPMPRNTEVFAPTFDGEGTVRSDDITRDRRFGRNAPYHGMPEGHLPVRSYLAVSVVSPTSGEVLGGFFFGHPEPGRFTARHTYLAEGLAAYSAIALDNARLFARERSLAAELSRSIVPEPPEVPGLALVSRYLPASTGPKIGGDWFDVIGLPGERTAFVIGDVAGHGVPAATTMAQIRTAVRAYALLGLPPGEVLRHGSALAAGLAEPGFATCFLAVLEPGGRLTYASAGHLPALLVGPSGAITPLGEAMAQPLGVGATYPQDTADLPPGAELVLYTDGLVETRTRDLTEGMDRLAAAVAALARPVTGAGVDALVAELTGGAHDDDIAIVHLTRLGGAGE